MTDFSKPPIILDGALGTELERRGFEARLPLWSAWALIEAPDLVKKIHADYVAAGAQVLTTATFRCTRYALFKERLDSWTQQLIELSVRLAREAAAGNPRVLVAGSMAPLEDCYHPEQAPDDETLEREHRRTAELLAAAGADLLLVETQNSVREAVISTRAALKTGLPVWVSLMAGCTARLLNGDPLSDAARVICGLGAEALLINCCPPPVAEGAYLTLRNTLPEARLGVYPNFALPGGKPWDFSARLSPQDFARWAKPLAHDASILGGCCGTTPEHIAELKKAVQE